MTISRAVGEKEERVIELRCPRDYKNPDGSCSPGKLFAELRVAGGRPQVIQPDNHLVLACGDCKRWYRRRGRDVFRVLHYYNLLGELMKTEILDEREQDGPPVPQA